MDTHWLGKLLTEADRKNPIAAVDAHELAAKILRIRRHRRLARYSVLSTTAAALIIGWMFWPTSRPIPVIAVAPQRQPVETLAELQHRADELERTVSVMLKAEDIAARRDHLASTPPALIDLPIERSAQTVLGEADRLSAAGSTTDAIQVYQQIVEHFPDSGAAAVARNNLRSMNAKG